ncbi:NAD(P)H-dependent glycerol-3-phosphate dehydrogenase [Moraxella bovis]|uniref:Glycerol-3-phosphate dehydrogenase [NAD(P)+] n=1 Tax=Moraxella bovis TaxID=476 RepID=A0A378Q3R0_MORBO|nr:NAD(P)H-dependent glycerol-3-phosphate dehydrogenase [Moraxella bovis]STY93777.1 Glycerol-3-phosphate dehydrogenase [NAD(P)+] [Moraxella bovis]
MKLPKDNPKVKKIVDVASQSINQGLEEARHLLEKSEAEGGILANLAHLAKKRKKEPDLDTLGIHVDKDMDTPLRIVVLGGGSFGTAMANLSAKNGCETTLWVRDKKTVKALQKTRINKKYLPNHVLDSRLAFSHDLAESVKSKDIIFVAVPSSAVRETLQNIRPYITHQAVVSLTKGIEKGTFALMSDIIKDELPQVNFGVMSGPNLALEIMNNMPSASVIASPSEPLRVAVQTALHSAFFRVFASDDVKGVELGGALKNIYAVAMGMANAYGVGENTKAMLLTRALAEMSRFGVAVGANPLTFLGLSGVGDLYATCNSTLSRNYQIGNMLGKGITLDNAIKKLGQTAEGVNTIAQVEEQAKKLGIYMPITHALYAVLYENKSALSVAVNLMETGFRSDVEFVMPHDESNEKLSKEFDKVLKASKDNQPKDDEAIDDKDDK